MAIVKIKGVVKEYAWGNKDFIPSLLGCERDEKPKAEYWMGTHPSGESLVGVEPLSSVIGRRLPFLFKVLAIESPLSLQCHPNKEEAKRGWEKEAEKRRRGEVCNYQDDNQKAEVLLALSPVTALCGFRTLEEGIGNLKRFIPKGYEEFLISCSTIKEIFLTLFGLSLDDKKSILSELEKSIDDSDAALVDGEYYTLEGLVKKDLSSYLGDIGSVFPLIMNLIHLSPGEAIYLEPDTLHAYSKGNGIELMTASDNVLRGGLTPKRIDLDELSSILYFGETRPETVRKERDGGLIRYITPCQEFSLASISDTAVSSPDGEDAIVIVTEGRTRIEGKSESIELEKGECAFIEKGERAYINVDGMAYMASGADK